MLSRLEPLDPDVIEMGVSLLPVVSLKNRNVKMYILFMTSKNVQTKKIDVLLN